MFPGIEQFSKWVVAGWSQVSCRLKLEALDKQEGKARMSHVVRQCQYEFIFILKYNRWIDTEIIKVICVYI